MLYPKWLRTSLYLIAGVALCYNGWIVYVSRSATIPLLAPSAIRNRSPRVDTDPALLVAAATHDFGVVSQTEPQSFSFEMRNGGGGALRIERVESACGCTAALPERRALKPGDRAQIKVDFNPAGLRGRFRKQVWLYSNDPQSPTSLFVTGEVKG